MTTRAQIEAARRRARAKGVEAAYKAGLQGRALPDGATAEERAAHGVARERRSTGRERVTRDA